MQRTILAAAVVVALALTGASSALAWAPAVSATIHPGVQVFTHGAQCTANFIFNDGTNTYIGQAAHCSGTGQATDTNGCTSGSLPIGTPVQIMGAGRPGTMVYNSWITMQAAGETDANACQYNDLALVQINPADVANVNPSLPHWGGPIGVGGATKQGDRVVTYGNSSLRGGAQQLSPKTGVSFGDDSGGWQRTVVTATPGIPGDSGSAFLNGTGNAIGVLSTLALAPVAGSNGVGDLSHELGYLYAHTSFGAVRLVNGTEPFNPPPA